MFFSFSLIEDSRHAEEAEKLKDTIYRLCNLLNHHVFIAVTLCCTSVSKKDKHFLTNTVELFSFAGIPVPLMSGINGKRKKNLNPGNSAVN